MTKTHIAAIAAVVGGVFAAASTATAALNLPTQNCAYTFTSNMRIGTRSQQVMDLQKVLNMYPQTTVALSGAGSMGNETMFFGSATRAAVIRLQGMHVQDILAPVGLTVGNGNVFSLTRAVLNQLCNGSTMNPTNPSNPTAPTTSGNVNVSLASNQPSTVLVAGQAAARLADFTFTGNGNVTMVKLMRTGVSNNTTLTNVYLYDGAERLTDAASVLVDGSVTFNNASGIFVVNGSRTVTVRADVLAGTNGQSVGIMLAGYKIGANAAAMTNLSGNQLPVATVTLAGVGFSGSQVAAASINAGQLNTNVWSQTMNVGTRAVKLHSMTFKMIGSAPTDALANVSLFIDGVKVGNSTMFGTNGRATFDMTASPMLINTGNRTVEVRADIVKGSYRNFQISIENLADVRIEDRDVPNAFISVTSVLGIPNQAGLITINAGNLTTNLDPAYNATQVVGGATNVEIGRFQMNAYGEDTKVTSLTVLPVLTGTTPAPAGLNNLSLYVNGGQVGTSFNWVSGNYTFNNLGSSLTIPAGSSAIVTVKADMVTTGGTNYTAGTASVNLIGGTTNAQGVNSQQLTGTGAVNGKTLSIVSGAASFGTTSGFNAQVVNQNTQNVKVGSFTMQASNADALRVTNLAVTIGVTGMPLTSITNLVVKDGAMTIGTPVGNVAATNNFSVSGLTIPAASSKLFEVYANIGNAANADTVTVGMTATYNGVTNTNTLTSTAAGVTMTVNTANLIAGTPVVNASPVSQYVTPGMRDIATFNIKSANGVSTIQKMTFNLATSTGINSITVGGVTKGIITGATTTTIDGLNINVPFTNSGVAINVAANFNAVGLNQTTSGLNNAISINNVEFTSGNTTAIVAIPGATSSTFTLVASMPTAVKGTGLSFGAGNFTGVKVGTYSVTANNSGDINLAQVIITVGLPTGGVFANPVLKQGGAIVAGSSCTGSSTVTCVFAPIFRIAAGTTANFDVTGDTGNITTSGVASVNAGANASFLWGDTNSANTLTGTLLQNYGN